VNGNDHLGDLDTDGKLKIKMDLIMCVFQIVYWIVLFCFVLFLGRDHWWVNNSLRPKIYSYNESQRDALFRKIYLIKYCTCFGQVHCPSSVVSQHCTHSNRYLSC